MSEAQAGPAKLALEAVTSGYGAIAILHELDLQIRAGEIFALMGKNGMGKTTLLKTIVGLLPLIGGTIRMDGAAVGGKSPSELVTARVAYAPQEQPLFQDLSIRDNLRLALPSDRVLKEGLARVHDHFPFLSDRLSQAAGTLSGGEQKMLIIARALMTRPQLLLIDEISEGLQPSVVARIAAALKAERDSNGTTILLVEQNLRFALGVADRWAVLKRGVLDDGGPVDGAAHDRVLQHLQI